MRLREIDYISIFLIRQTGRDTVTAIRTILSGILLLSVSMSFAANSDKHIDAQAQEYYASMLAKLKPLAEKGDAASQLQLGTMYSLGQGVPQDYTVALAWDRKAADQGNATAQVELGYIFETGEGVSQDYAEAISWYRKAADQKNRFGYYKLSKMYEYGQGVPQDFVKAYALLNLYGSNDANANAVAGTARRDLMRGMTKAQIAEGQAMTRKMLKVGVLKTLDAQ